MADSFWAETQEYKRSKETYKGHLFLKVASTANDATKPRIDDVELKGAPAEEVTDQATEKATAAMVAHSLEEADTNKTEQPAAVDPCDPLNFLRFSPAGLKSDDVPSFDLRKVTEIVKRMREDSEKGKSKVKKNEWERIDKVLGHRK